MIQKIGCPNPGFKGQAQFRLAWPMCIKDTFSCLTFFTDYLWLFLMRISFVFPALCIWFSEWECSSPKTVHVNKDTLCYNFLDCTFYKNCSWRLSWWYPFLFLSGGMLRILISISLWIVKLLEYGYFAWSCCNRCSSSIGFHLFWFLPIQLIIWIGYKTISCLVAVLWIHPPLLSALYTRISGNWNSCAVIQCRGWLLTVLLLTWTKLLCRIEGETSQSYHGQINQKVHLGRLYVVGIFLLLLHYGFLKS